MRRSPRCRPRGSVGTLSRPLELELVLWGGWRIPGLSPPPADVVRLWKDHRDVILPRWLETCPGVRPWPMYLSAELPVPPVVRTPRLHAPQPIPIPTGGMLLEQFAYDEPEHLQAIGVVDAEEKKRYLHHRKTLGYRWHAGAGYEPVT